MHEEYARIVPGAKTAILFIHGILGTPRHFDMFAQLVPHSVSVRMLLLPGHGEGVKEFSAASMKQWVEYVDDAVEQLLKYHKNVLIVGHSMGTLFAIEQAVKRPDRIGGIFLLATPLKLFLKPSMVSGAMKVYFNHICEDDERAKAMYACCSITHSKQFWLYFGWIPRFLELFSQIRRTNEMIEHLSVPCWVFQSKHDEMVSLRVAGLLEKNPNVELHMLPMSTHYYYPEEDNNRLKVSFEAFLTRNL